MMTAEMRLKKAHITLMKHPETALYSGVILMGKNEVMEGIPTACTDGINKMYGREFLEKLQDNEIRGLVLHENLHVALKHRYRFESEFKDNPMLTNVALDYAVNDIIVHLKDKELCKLPDGGLYDEKFHNWSAREIYNYLKNTLPPQPKIHISVSPDGGEGDEKGQSQSIKISIDGKEYEVKTSDEHDFAGKELSIAEQAQMSDAVDKALREGGILAGRMGAKMPRSIADLLEPQVDWRHALREFITSSTRGSDEYTWRKFNKRMMANDLYLPSMENESVGEIVVAIDTSGSIGGEEITEFATELVSICNAVSPSKIRVLWWDTEVHGEQIFHQDSYGAIKSLLKPLGGGGTMVKCVDDYVVKNKINMEGLLVFTDGYCEGKGEIEWLSTAPTLWLVTRNRNYTPPHGKMVNTKER